MKRIYLAILLSILTALGASCDRFDGVSNVKAPVQTVDFQTLTGKSLQELTKKLGSPAEPCPTCGYTWELQEGHLNVNYEDNDSSKRWMSTISYTLKPGFAVGSTDEMIALLKINFQGKPEQHRKGFFTYKNVSANGMTGFADVRPQVTNLIFGPREPKFAAVDFFVKNPEIRFHARPNREGFALKFWEQKDDIDISAESVWLEDGDWEICTGAEFTGKCETLLDDKKYDEEYSAKLKNFRKFGLGTKIGSFRPIKPK